MAEKEYIEREAFIEQKRKQYCEDCSRRKGFKRGQYKILYEIGEAPCRACEIDDLLNDVEDFPTADVRPVVTCGECEFWNRERISCEGLARCNTGENGIRYRNRDDFCSRGKKREES